MSLIDPLASVVEPQQRTIEIEWLPLSGVNVIPRIDFPGVRDLGQVVLEKLVTAPEVSRGKRQNGTRFLGVHEVVDTPQRLAAIANKLRNP